MVNCKTNRGKKNHGRGWPDHIPDFSPSDCTNASTGAEEGWEDWGGGAWRGKAPSAAALIQPVLQGWRTRSLGGGDMFFGGFGVFFSF